MPRAHRAATLLSTFLLVLARPAIAAGQGPDGSSRSYRAQEGLVVSAVESGPVLGGDVKFVTVGDQAALFVGGSSGYVFDGTFLLAGAIYARVDRSYKSGQCDGSGCIERTEPGDVYAGALLGWRAVHTTRATVGVHGLLGLGYVTLGWDGSRSVVSPQVPPLGSPSSADAYYLYGQSYAVFEPQVDVSVRVGPKVTLAGGVGYRMVGYANGLGRQLEGMTVSFSVRVRHF